MPPVPETMHDPTGRPRALVLSGWMTATSSKAAFARGLGFEVACPRLPAWRLGAAIRLAAETQGEFEPDVVVGASRGGAIALAIPTGRPLVLLAPAWRLFGVRPRPDVTGVVIHSGNDRLVPLRHSRALCRACPGLRLVVAGAEHKLNCPEGRKALAEALDDLVGLPTPRRAPEG